jgi:hypothetical protein
MATNPANGAWGGLAPGQSVGSVRVLNSTAGGAPGGPVIIEHKEATETKPEGTPKDPQKR